MSSRTLTVITLAILLFSQTLPGQSPTADTKENIPVIHTTTREVLLDLVVRDKHHHAVTDLKPEEITVYEDGVPQKITAFHNIQGAEELQTERTAAQAQGTAQTAGATPSTAANPSPTAGLIKAYG
jgi:hypothetical protein